MPRPFLKTDIVVLEEHAGDFALKQDLAGLRELEAELRFRKTERARRLLIEVLTWAQELERKQTQAQLAAIMTRVAELEAQTRAAAAANTNGVRLYAEVGLHPQCPDFVLSAVRRAYQKAYHPDVRAVPNAAQRFREYEELFDRLEQGRKT